MCSLAVKYLSVKLHVRDVRLSVVYVRGVRPIGGRSAMFHRNLTGD